MTLAWQLGKIRTESEKEADPAKYREWAAAITDNFIEDTANKLQYVNKLKYKKMWMQYVAIDTTPDMRMLLCLLGAIYARMPSLRKITFSAVEHYDYTSMPWIPDRKTAFEFIGLGPDSEFTQLEQQVEPSILNGGWLSARKTRFGSQRDDGEGGMN